MKNKSLDIKKLIKIGEDAIRGKICNQCGRNFKKEIGHIRICKKCKKQ